jgi:hypothetical protein
MNFKITKNISLEEIKNHLSNKGFKNVYYENNILVFSGRKLSDVIFFSQVATYNSIDSITFEKNENELIVNIDNLKLKIVTVLVLLLFGLMFYKIYDLQSGYAPLVGCSILLILMYCYSILISVYRVKKDLKKM